jgi:hypothetical protein
MNVMNPPRGRVSDEEAKTRRHARFILEVDVTVRSPTLGLIPGMSIEMSESGMSAILPVEVPVGETVDLRINLPLGPVDRRAVVRNRNAFRHGFEFGGRNKEDAVALQPNVNET